VVDDLAQRKDRHEHPEGMASRTSGVTCSYMSHVGEIRSPYAKASPT
jgi:hypothetical protein